MNFNICKENIAGYMKIEELKVLDGPNYWSVKRHKLILMRLDLEALEDCPTNTIPGFNLPVKLTNGQWIYPTNTEQKIKSESKNFTEVEVDKNFYVQVKKD